jgi:hypothetical protein
MQYLVLLRVHACPALMVRSPSMAHDLLTRSSSQRRPPALLAPLRAPRRQRTPRWLARGPLGAPVLPQQLHARRMAAPPPCPPPPPRAAAPAAGTCPHFRVLHDGEAVEVDEAGGNALHLGPILRRYTSARLTAKASGRTTTVERALLYDALGLLRSLQHDVAAFNAAAGGCGEGSEPPLTGSALRYACYRLTRQAAAFGARVPRPGTGTVHVPGLDELVCWIESRHSTQLDAAAALLAGGCVDFASLAELFAPGRDVLDRGAATGLFGVPTAFRARGGYFTRGKSLFGVVSTYFAALECVVAVDGRFAVVECTIPVPEFSGTRSVREGLEGFVLLTDAMKAELTQRGELYAATAGEGALCVPHSPTDEISATDACSAGWGTRLAASCRRLGRAALAPWRARAAAGA